MNTLRRCALHHQHVDLVEAADANKVGIAELAVIGDDDRFFRLLDHRAREFGFLEVVIHESAGGGNPADRQDRVIDVKLAHEVDRRGTEGRPVVDAQRAAAEVDAVAGFARQRARDFRAIGDHGKVAMRAQGARHVGRGRAGVEHDRIAVFDYFREPRRDQLLGLDALVHALFEWRFGFLFLAEDDAAMHLFHQPLAHQRLDVAANGLVRHVELPRQLDDGAGAVQAHRGEYFVLSFLRPHRGSRLHFE